MQYLVVVRFSADGKLDIDGNKISISIKSRPERGMANREIIKRLAEYFQVPSQNVRILSGLASRKKVVDILSLQIG